MGRGDPRDTLAGMPSDPALLVRRWPERRGVVLAGAATGFAAVAAVVHLSGDSALGMLHVVPVLLVALELGAAGGLIAAGVATALVVAGGAIVPAFPAVAVGLIAGRFSSRMRGLHEREQRLLESAIALGDLGAHDQLPQAVADAALQTPGATGVEVVLEGLPRAVRGQLRGDVVTTGIVVRGEKLGSIELAHRRPLEPEDRAALELLAFEAGRAADNHRLLVREREAAAMQAELRHVRDDLLEQRAGLGQLLDEQEDQRRRHAETLHEELAQVLAGVLMRLRAGDWTARSRIFIMRSGGYSPSCVTLRPRCVRHRWRSWVCCRRWRRSTDSPSRPTTSPSRFPSRCVRGSTGWSSTSSVLRRPARASACMGPATGSKS
jgi:hypothetical protein